MAHSLTSSESLLRCHRLSETSADLPIKFAVVLARMPPDPGPSFSMTPSAEGANRTSSVFIVAIIILTHELTQALTKCTSGQHFDVSYL